MGKMAFRSDHEIINHSQQKKKWMDKKEGNHAFSTEKRKFFLARYLSSRQIHRHLVDIVHMHTRVKNDDYFQGPIVNYTYSYSSFFNCCPHAHLL